MKETVDFDNNPYIEKFAASLSETFTSSFAGICSHPFNLSPSETVYGNAEDVFKAFEGETLVKASEEKGVLDCGLLFKTRDITKLADFMLAGDGESSDEIDPDTKDAIKEMTSQLMSSLNIPLEGVFGVKFDFRSHDIVKNDNQGAFTDDQYLMITLDGDVDGVLLNFLFFIDSGVAARLGGADGDSSNLIDDASIDALLGASPQGGLDMSSMFEEPQGGGGGNAKAPKNLDLLLDIDIPISVRMGSAKLFLKDILGLGPGNIVELDQNADDAIELAINDKVIARGEVVIADGYFGFRIKEIVSKADRIKTLKD